MPKYTVISAVRTGGKLHREGEEIELDEAVAADLLDLGRINPTQTKPGEITGGKSTGKKTDGGA